MFRALALLLTCVYTLSAQDSVAPEFMYHHVWAVVPLIGKGTKDDPRRPMFVPSQEELKASAAAQKSAVATDKKVDVAPPAIISYTMQVSDDGKSALVEFVGLNPQSLAFITTSKAPGVKAFERGKATKAEIEAEFQKSKREFKLDSFQARAK